MANNLGSLVVSLGLDAAEFTRGLSKNEYKAQQWARNVSTAVDGVRTYALGSFAAIGGAIAVLNQQANDVAAFQDLAEKIGDSAEQVASLKTAADLSGTSLDTVASASVKLTAALAKTDDESKGVGLALKSIGLEMEAFKALKPAEQLDTVSQALAGFADGAGKTAVAVQLFGKSGADLLPFLNDLADEGGRQVTLTNEQIKAADEYSKATARLASEVDTLAKVTAAEAAPALTDMVQMLRDVLQYSTSASEGIGLLDIATGAATKTLQTIIGVGSDVAYVFKTVGDTMGAYAAVSARLISGDLAGAKAIGAAYREASAARRQDLDAFQFKTMNPELSKMTPDEMRKRGIGATARPTLRVSTPAAAGGGRARAAAGKDPILEANEREADMLRLLGKIEDEEVAKSLANAQRRRDATIEEFDAISRANTEYQSFVQSLVDATPTAQLERQRAAMQVLAEEYERGRFGAAGSAEAVAAYGETVNAFLGNLGKDVEAVNATAEQGGSIFGTWLERAITDGAKLSDVINGLIRDLVQLAIRKAVIEPAAGLVSTGISAFFGGSFDGGGYTGSGSRSGGVDGKGGFPAILHPNETVVDHTKGQGMGGSVSITYQVDARGADAGSEARMRQALKDNAAQTKADIMNSINRGGTWARATGRA